MLKYPKVYEELTDIKIDSAVRRLNIAYYISLGLGVCNLIYEILNTGSGENIDEKLAMVFSFGSIISINQYINKNKSAARGISFLFGECVNLFLIYLAYVKEKNCALIWSQLAPFVIMYYQSYLLQSFFGMIILSLKHTVQWTFANYYFSVLSVNHLPSMFSAICGLFFLMVACCYLNHLQDIDLCKSKENVKAANKKLNSLVEAIPKCISVISEKFQPLFLNSSFKMLVKEENFIFYLESLKYYFRFNQGLGKGQLFSDIKSSFSFEIGSKVTFGITDNLGNLIEWTGKIDVWEEEKVIILFGKDVTELIKLEKESIENKYKSMLLRTVSHELRTPTNAMLTMSQFLIESKELSNENLEKANIIASSCSYLLCLINDLLDYAQIMAGCLKVLKVPFNLSKLLKECLKIFELELNTLNIYSQIVYSNEVPLEIITDPHRLKQIIINLLGNAKKFTRNGSIKLKISFEHPNLTIICKDTGTGIDENKISSLFTSFGRLDNSVLNPQGVGLGLYISNMLVNELGGNGIKVSSKIGKGSTFKFHIPISLPNFISSDPEVADENPNISLPSSTSTKMLEKIKILVVDDTYFNILAYIQIFKAEGISCKNARNGIEAIERVRKEEFDCIIMDCEMPFMNGWEATRILKEMQSNGQIKLPPIIGTTAYDSDNIRCVCKNAGMDDVLIKPSPKKDIMKKVMYWIEASKFL